jgi:ATP-dependent helicase/nuclease subunit B
MGDERLALPDLFYGLRLQLITYLDAALSLWPHDAEVPLKPGGLLYFRIQDPILSCECPPACTDFEQDIIKAMKMRGFILADQQVACLMDDKIGTDGYRTSELIPVNMLKDGAFDSRSAVLRTEQMEILLRHTETLLKQSGYGILQGVVDIKPYKMNGQTACTFCQYSSVCQFDELLEDNLYNHLHKITPAFIWDTLGLAKRED